MAAPVAIARTHVHSLRIRSGAEALVARVRAADGTAGFGFTLNLDAGVARDMAAWDALARSKGVALPVLLGGFHRKNIPVARDDLPALLRIDPFAWGSVEMVPTIAAAAAASGIGMVLLAPNAHPWEIQYCAALAAALPGDGAGIIVRGDPAAVSIAVSEAPGIGIDWSFEPAFELIRWLP